MADLFGTPVRKDAVISDDGFYRYSLSRDWSPVNDNGQRLSIRLPLLWVGVNPSTADSTHDDPTIEKMTGFTTLWGYPGFYVGNRFPYRATDPSELFRPKAGANPWGVGGENCRHLTWMAEHSAKVICCWGNHGDKDWLPGGWADFIHALRCCPGGTWALGVNKNGTPKHQLYLPKSTQLEEYKLW